MRPVSDLTGRRFGRLTVLREDGRSKGGKVLWLCRCDCGRETRVMSHNLVGGKTTGCGRICPLGSKIQPGDRFGALVALEKISRHGSATETMWLCRCDCGQEAYVRSSSLLGGLVTSCGCRSEQDMRRAESDGITDGTRPSMLARQNPNHGGTSGVRGVSWDARHGLWRAVIQAKGRKWELGRYADLADAAEARRAAEEALFDPVLERHGRAPTSEDDYRAALDAALRALRDGKGPR